MPQYLITAPDGQKYNITAPAGATQDQVFGFAKSQWAAMKPPGQSKQLAKPRDIGPTQGGFRGAPPAPQEPGFLPGVVAGARSDFDMPAEALARGAGDVAHWVGLTGWTPGKNTETADAANQQQMQQKHGSEAGYGLGQMVGQIAGTVPLGEGAGNALRLIPGAVRVGEGMNALAKANRGVDLVTLPARAAVRGVVPGAVAGVVTSPGTPGRGAAKGAGIGAVLGGALGSFPLVGTFGRWVVSAPIKAVLDAAKPAEERAYATVLKALFDRGLTPDGAAAEIKARGPNAMLADLPELRSTGKGVVNTASPGATSMRDALEARAESGEARVTGTIKTATGSGDVYGSTDTLKATRSKAAAPLFKDLETIQPTSEQLEQVNHFIQSPEGQKALSTGLTTMRRQALAAGQKFNPSQFGLVTNSAERASAEASLAAARQELYELQPVASNKKFSPYKPRDPGVDAKLEATRKKVEDAGNRLDAAVENDATGPGPKRIDPGKPSMPLLHAIKEGFDDNVESLRDPMTLKLPNTKEVNALDDVRTAYRKKLTSMFPQYKAALDAWSGPSRSMQVQAIGRKVLSQDHEVTTKFIQNLSPNDKAFFLNGVARALLDKVQGNAESVPDARAIFGNTMIRARIQAALGPGETFDQFEKAMQQELNIAKSNRAYLGGSPTSENESAKGAVSAAKGVFHALTGNHIAAAGHLATAARGVQDDEFLSALSKILVDTDQGNSLAKLIAASPTGRAVVGRLLTSKNALAGLKLVAPGVGMMNSLSNNGNSQ